MMNATMNENRAKIAKSASVFAAETLDPIASNLDHTGVYPRAVIEQLAAEGFLGLFLPEKWGGTDAGFASYVEAVQALSRSCAAVASILNNHVLAAHAIDRWGNESQKTEYLAALAAGKKLGTLATYETGSTPGVGTDALIASRHGTGFTLTGTKAFVRNAGAADVYVVFATLELAAETDGMTAFLVDANTPGLTVGPELDTMGLKGCPVAHLTFLNVSLAEGTLLGSVTGGTAIADHLLAVGAVAEGAQTVGIGKAAARHAADYAKHRVQFRHPVAALQAIQTMLTEVATDSHLAWLGVQQTAQLIDSGAPFKAEAAMVKAFLARFGSRMLIEACQVEGGLGISETAPKGVRENLPLARMFRDIAGTTLLDAPADFPDKLIAEAIA